MSQMALWGPKNIRLTNEAAKELKICDSSWILSLITSKNEDLVRLKIARDSDFIIPFGNPNHDLLKEIKYL